MKIVDRAPVTAGLRQRGFTLVELMIVVVIVGILAGIAIPNYQAHVRKANRKDAMGALQGLAQAMERHYAEGNTYIGAAGSKGSPTANGAPWVFSAKSPIDGKAMYNLTINADIDAFTLRATPVAGTPQESDGFIELNSAGQRSWDRDNSGSFSSSEHSWSDH